MQARCKQVSLGELVALFSVVDEDQWTDGRHEASSFTSCRNSLAPSSRLGFGAITKTLCPQLPTIASIASAAKPMLITGHPSQSRCGAFQTVNITEQKTGNLLDIGVPPQPTAHHLRHQDPVPLEIVLRKDGNTTISISTR